MLHTVAKLRVPNGARQEENASTLYRLRGRSRNKPRAGFILPFVTIAVVSALSACATAPTSPTESKAPALDFLPCMVSDTGGYDDHSFNQSARDGLEAAAEKLGTKFIAVESEAETDYKTNVQGLVAQGCDLIITVGYLLSNATVSTAQENPEIDFAIIDDFADLDADGKTDSPNIKPILFDTVQAAFLGGYAAASYSKTGIVGTFAGMNIPPVTIFLDGYVQGVDYFNEVNGTNVKVLGWDFKAQNGLAIGSFAAGIEAMTAARSLISQGADVIQSGGGTTYVSSIAAFEDAGIEPVVIGGDSDMYFADPVNASAFLISVLKGTKTAVTDVVESSATDGFDNTPYIGTLANGGVGVSSFHDFESKIDPSLVSDLDAIKQGIIDGSIAVTSPSSPK